MDSDSSAREAALHKRRERDQDHCDRDSFEERPDSLGADILEKSEVQNFDCYVIMSYQQNPNKCIVQEYVRNYIRCIYNVGVYIECIYRCSCIICR